MKWPASDGNPLGQRCCATSAEQWDSSPKSVLLKEKNRAPSIREQPVTGGNESAYSEYGAGFEPLPSIRRVESTSSLKCPVWQRRLLVPVGSCTQKTRSIG